MFGNVDLTYLDSIFEEEAIEGNFEQMLDQDMQRIRLDSLAK